MAASVELDPKDVNNAPLEPAHDKDYGSTRTTYQCTGNVDSIAVCVCVGGGVECVVN